MKRHLSSVLLLLPLSSITQAAVIVRFIEAGGNVEASMEGTFNLDGWSYFDENVSNFDLLQISNSIGYTIGSPGITDWEFEDWQNPGGTFSLSGLDSFTGSSTSIAPLSGPSGIAVFDDRILFTSTQSGVADLYNPAVMQTLSWSGTLLGLIGDDEFEVTYTFPDPDGLGPGISESVTFTTVVPEPNLTVLLVAGLMGLATVRRRQ